MFYRLLAKTTVAINISLVLSVPVYASGGGWGHHSHHRGFGWHHVQPYLSLPLPAVAIPPVFVPAPVYVPGGQSYYDQRGYGRPPRCAVPPPPWQGQPWGYNGGFYGHGFHH